jgi:hypothetical protein
MPKNRRIHFRITEPQYARIKANAEAEGYITIAAYLRYLALEHDLLIDKKIIQMSRQIQDMHGILSKAKLHSRPITQGTRVAVEA